MHFRRMPLPGVADPMLMEQWGIHISTFLPTFAVQTDSSVPL
jgi:hypothetical protein